MIIKPNRRYYLQIGVDENSFLTKEEACYWLVQERN